MSEFRFKQFVVNDNDCAMKVGTDSVLLGTWTDLTGVTSALDLGTGSGLLALMVAQRAPMASVVGVEINADAAAAATRNFALSPWTDRLKCVASDAFAYSPAISPDLIICNPPYFASSLLSPDRGRAQARHVASDPDDEAFGPLAVISLADRWLSGCGSLAMVTPVEYDDSVTFSAAMHRLDIYRKCMVSTVEGRTPSRILWQMSRRNDRSFALESMAVRRIANNNYTTEYHNLTKDFYLNG